jgi:hypothetical protein
LKITCAAGRAPIGLRKTGKKRGRQNPAHKTGRNLGTHRFQRTIAARGAAASNGSRAIDCALEAMRTQACSNQFVDRPVFICAKLRTYKTRSRSRKGRGAPKTMKRWSRTEVEAEPIAAPGSKPEAGINKQGNRVIQTVLPVISRMSVRIRPRALGMTIEGEIMPSHLSDTGFDFNTDKERIPLG